MLIPVTAVTVRTEDNVGRYGIYLMTRPDNLSLSNVSESALLSR